MKQFLQRRSIWRAENKANSWLVTKFVSAGVRCQNGIGGGEG